MASMALLLYKEAGYSGINPKVTTMVATKLMQAVSKGYGAELWQLQYNTPDYDKLLQLTSNVWQFAAAKNLAQLNQLSKLLIDTDGTVRSRKSFIQEASKLSYTFANRWLGVEYDTAVGNATMASKWVEIQANKKNAPLLQFDAVIDSQTSDVCRPLDGIIAPVDDPFWDKYYPLNHFKCRSTVRQLASGTPSTAVEIHKAINEIKISPQFEVNLAKKGWIFPEKHPYFNELTDAAVKEIKLAYKRSVYARPVNEQYVSVYKNKNGGEVRKHLLVQPNNKDGDDDYFDNINAAKAFAEKGMKVELLPRIYVTETEARKKLFPNYENIKSNPDLRVDDVYMDNKRPFSSDNIRENIISAKSQSAIAIISDSRYSITKTDIEGAQHYLNTSKTYHNDVLYLYIKGNIITLNRKRVK